MLNKFQAFSEKFPADLVLAIGEVYENAGMKVSKPPVCEPEGADYGACRFGLDDWDVVFRVAKTTPTKTGQFVTIWKRPLSGGVIVPIDISDGIDFVVIAVSDETHCGQFVFNQKLLLAQGIMSRNGRGGKRAIRVYPPWTKPVAKQALKTQNWQLKNFLLINSDGHFDIRLLRRLFAVDVSTPENISFLP